MPARAPDCDLHPYFREPDKARAILDACIADNRSRGILLVRVVHGKGKGDFRNLIHSHLNKHPDIEGFLLCDPMHGGSGASWVHIAEDPEHPAVERMEIPGAGVWYRIWRWPLYALAFGCLYLIFDLWLAILLAVGIVVACERTPGVSGKQN